MKLCFPEKVLEQHAIWLGKTRAGKSSSMRHVVEWLLAKNQRLCVVDPKGDWYGLKSSADGKSAGFEVILFGDFKDAKATDVPINDHSGKHIAELIASGNRPCVIGMRGWSNAAQSRFWIDFASTLFNSNLAGGLKLFVDEVQNFAPKERTGIGQENEALGWTKRLLSEGSGLGLTIFCGSQRPASVHNGVLTQCETLVAMRVIHASDRAAAEQWIKGCGDKAMGATVLDSLAALHRGEAFMWSPESGFGPERVQFPMFETFDSFAPPQLQKKISSEGWASVNLDDVKSKLASVIEESKANDPALLKQEIARLKKEASKKQPAPVESKPVEVPVMTEDDRKLIERAEKLCSQVTEAMEKNNARLIDSINDMRNFLAPIKQKLSTPPSRVAPQKKLVCLNAGTKTVISRPALSTSPQADTGELTIGKCERAILTALAQYPQGRTMNQLSILTGYTQGGMKNSLGKLRTAEFINRGQPIQIHEAGFTALGHWEPLPTGEDMQAHWLARSGKCERAILGALLAVYPDGMTMEQLSEQTGYSEGGMKNSLGRLRTLELVDRGQPIKASDEFFQ